VILSVAPVAIEPASKQAITRFLSAASLAFVSERTTNLPAE
jgi:hypothetical protein